MTTRHKRKSIVSKQTLFSVILSFFKRSNQINMPILSTKNTIACVRLLKGLKSPTPPAPRPGDDKIIQEL